ncbi:dUTP diphosphatase [Alteromonas sp. RKMC-009]|uniref:dUTP diphosphatase n=1 Tax=Alteromonas sp. RKMC-009 TaxID=2267264 RepID=UPI000E68D700|nr:dUTP diphosphatase [Alteromonas sp. RKMC-009]AYA64300.1 dUTP diphosphatase [Alteromonas sp. RKMC-009]
MTKVLKLHADAVIPAIANPGDAGLDLTAIEPVVIKPGCQANIRTGLAFGLPEGTVGLIWPRSKLAAKYGLDVMAGVVDQGYTGEVMVNLINHSDRTIELFKGDKVAQMLIQPVYSSMFDLEVVDSLEETQRGTSGINDTEMRLRN